MKLRKNEPIGMGGGYGFVTRKDSCGVEWIERPIYTEDVTRRSDQMRNARKHGGMSLREASAVLGITLEQMSGLEHERYDFTREADRVRAIDLLTRNTTPADASEKGGTKP